MVVVGETPCRGSRRAIRTLLSEIVIVILTVGLAGFLLARFPGNLVCLLAKDQKNILLVQGDLLTIFHSLAK